METKRLLKYSVIFYFWVMFLWGTPSFTYINSKDKLQYKLQITGIMWVCLDHYSIWKYNSLDTPKQVFVYTKTNT
jgi:hypothetical protein